MIEFDNYFNKSRANYLFSKEDSLGIEFRNDVLLDYVRCLLIKRESFNEKIFFDWCTENNNLDIYDIAINDIKYLENKKFIFKKDNIYYFKNANSRNKLFLFQKKHIDKNEYRLNLENKLKKNSLSNEIVNISKERFNNEILTNKESIEKFLNFSSQVPTLSFGNLIGSFVQILDNNINISMLRTHSFWKKSINNLDVDIIDNKPISILIPLIKDKKIVNYHFLNFFDISQTNINENSINLKKHNIDEIVKRLENSIINSSINKKIIKKFSSTNNDISSKDRLEYFIDLISEYYFFDNDEKSIFKHLLRKSFLLESKLEDTISLSFIKNKLANCISTFNLISAELLINDIIHDSILDTPFYYKLGERDLNKIDIKNIENEDKDNYLLAKIKSDDTLLYKSINIAKDILENETLSFEKIFQNLFLYSLKVTILTGDFKNKEFIVDGDYNEEEAKDYISNNILNKLIEDKLIKNINLGGNNGRNNDKELYGREYSDNIGRLHDETSKEEILENDKRENIIDLSNIEISKSNRRNEESDISRVQRERSLGYSERGDFVSRLEFDFIPLKYQEYFKNAHYSNFKHTQSGDILDVMKLENKLSKEAYIEFNKFMAKNDLGYYSRVSKSFIIKNKSLINYFLSLQENKKDYVKNIADSGMIKNIEIQTANKKTVFLGLNIDDGEVFVDENNIRSFSYKDNPGYRINENTKIIPGIGYKGSSLEENFLNGKFELLTKEELIEYSNNSKLISQLNETNINLLKEIGYFDSFQFNLEDETQHNDFLKLNYSKMNVFEKNKYQDLIDSIFQKRAYQFAVFFKLEDNISEWLKIAKFTNSAKDTNVIGMSIFDIEDTLKDFEDYSRDICKSKEFFKWYCKYNFNEDFFYSNNDIQKTLKEMWNKIEEYDIKENFSFIDFKEALENITNKLEIKKIKYEIIDSNNFDLEMDLKDNKLIVKNLKEFYGIKEIDETFIKNGVVWEIFSNKYIFDLENQKHLELINNDLNIKLLNTENNHYFNNYVDDIEKLNNNNEVKDLFNRIKKDNLDNKITNRQYEIIFDLLNKKIEANTKIEKEREFNNINILRSKGDIKYKEYLTKYNNKYSLSLLEDDLIIDKEMLNKYSGISKNNLVLKFNNTDNIEIDSALALHNEIFFDNLEIKDLEKDFTNTLNIDTSENEDFQIKEEINIGGSKTKFKTYIEGINIIRKIENNEVITLDEKKVLSRMPGTGTIAQAFTKTDGSYVKGWEKEAEELKETLTKEEYEAASRATLDAYYTDEFICKAMWKAIDNFGFSGGSVLEPACGNGNFFGYIPTHLKPNSQLIGIEINKTAAKVAQILYPKAKIFNIGFQDFSLLDDQKASLVIGNPPYGSHKIIDNNHKELNGLTIHNYFMSKSIDCLENGGVAAMIVSNSFLDSKDPTARIYIGKYANLIASIRLPKGAFSNANTEIVTDILFFQKLQYKENSNLLEWLNIEEINDTPINQYYLKNPENLLGKWGKYGTMYRGDEPSLIAFDGQDTKELLMEAINNLPKYINFHSGKRDYSKYMNQESSISSSERIMTYKYNNLAKTIARQNNETMSVDARINSYFINNDKIYKRLANVNGEVKTEEITTKINSKGENVSLSDIEIDRIKGMIKIAEVGNKLRIFQLDENKDDDSLNYIRNELNLLYDEFVKKYGFLNKNINVKLFEDDVFSPFLLSLEKNYDKGISNQQAKLYGVNYVKESAEKSDIFYKRTQSPYKAPTSAKSYEDALHISLTEKTYVDLSFMSSLLNNKNIEDISKYLNSKELIYNDPNLGWVTKEEYLSGNVKEKLKQTDNPLNIAALTKVIPKDIEAIDISVACGSTWIPKTDIEDFIKEVSGASEAKVYYIRFSSSWNINSLVASIDKENIYGTSRRNAKDIILAALNNKQIIVHDKFINELGEEKSIINQEETTMANDKVDLVKEFWNDWIWNSADRRERLAKIYNDKFNVFANREYNGSHLILPGKVDDSIIELRPHQKNAIWRVLQNGRNLFDHTVGSGKTFTAIASAMELKRTNKARKILVVVPNHLTKEWGNQWLLLYPNANILVPSEKDFSAKRRKILMSRIATGDYDAVIIAHSQLSLLENDKSHEAKFLQDQVEEIKEAINIIRSEKNQGSLGVKQWEKRKASIEARILSLLNANKKDDNLTFGDLGIDGLIVDEAHEFKNLQFHTSLNRIRGLGNPIGSQKAFDLFIKIKYLLEKTNNKNLLFLTGTPISNSMAELYTMQRYMMMDQLRIDELEYFDAWAKQYTEIKTDWELSASGKYKLVTRMSKFKNMPELMANYKNFSDVVTITKVKEQLALEGKTLDIPGIKGGKPKNEIIERNEIQAEIFEDLVRRSENLPKGKPKKGDDNMLVIMNDAKKASLDIRLINPNLEDNKTSKVNYMLDQIIDSYHYWNDIKGTQLIFCDLSTPKGSKLALKKEIEELVKLADLGDEKAVEALDKYTPDDLEALNNDFSVYDDIKMKLIERGIPENEIAFIHDAKTPLQKEELFLKVNAGKIRFLLGSTSKMGAGTNVQKRLVNLAHIDVPWRPSDLEQREGRIVRQGNLIFKFFKSLQKNEYDIELLKKDSSSNSLLKELNLSDENIFSLIDKAKECDSKFCVTINRYATKNTLDSGLWEKIEAKARFIEQLKNGNILEREVEDISGEEANAAEMKAASSGNPLILEDMQLKQQIQKLEAIKKNFNRSLHDREKAINYYENMLSNEIPITEDYLEDIKQYKEYKTKISEKKELLEELKKSNKEKGIKNKDLEIITDLEFISPNKIYDKREELGSYIMVKANELRYESNLEIKSIDIGTIAGFNVFIEKPILFKETEMTLNIQGKKDYSIFFDTREQTAIGIAIKLINCLDRIETNYNEFLASNNSIRIELPKLKELPTIFQKEEELQLLRKRHKVVISLLQEDVKDKTNNKNTNNTNNLIIKNTWEDINKDIDTFSILSNKRIDLSILNKIDFSFTNNCLILNNTLERNDYLNFQKIFELFGGNWDKKLNGIVFSDDGIKRIKETLEFKNINSDIENLASIITEIETNKDNLDYL